MSKVSMTATVAFRYAGRRLVPGDTFEATPAHARQLRAIKRAMPADAVGNEVTDDRPPARRKYARRDMQAQPDAQAPDPASDEDKTEPPGKRHYKRRDMTADSDAD